MLVEALRAQITLVGVTTDDPLNSVKIIRHLSKGRKVISQYPVNLTSPVEVVIKESMAKEKASIAVIEMDLAHKIKRWGALRADLRKAKRILIVINPNEKTLPYLFEAGPLTPPLEMVETFVAQHALPAHTDSIVESLKGLNLSQVLNVSKLARPYTSVQVTAVRRRLFFDVNGLVLVNTDMTNIFYDPEPKLKDWMELDGRLFVHADILQPRGLLLAGPSGTGKTLGAKWIAHNLSVPLYRLNFATMMSKWQGDTEKDLEAALEASIIMAPCVLLIDEVEKAFKIGSGDTGAASRAMSILLWFMQEHQSKILIVMTTNDEKSIPPELHREGRIDATITIGNIRGPDIEGFIAKLNAWWGPKTGVQLLYGKPGQPHDLWMTETVSQSAAYITEFYMSVLKHKYLEKLQTNQGDQAVWKYQRNTEPCFKPDLLPGPLT